MKFDYDTYVVLDLLPPIAERIMTIRDLNYDWWLKSLPAEITVAGSSGVGVFDPSQDPGEAFDVLNAITLETAPIHASFGDVLRFPDTNIFVFTLADEKPFLALHERIVKSGLRFKESPFPYKPHCTISTRPVSEEKASEILSLKLEETFVLDTMSVYMLEKLPMSLLHSAKLIGEKR